MSKKNVGILMGGNSSERGISLETSKEVFKYLDKEKYNVICIDWKLDNTFDVYKVNEFVVLKNYNNINELFINNKFDVIFNGLHGKNGEDGKIQGYLDIIGVPYTGSGVFTNSVGMNKVISKKLFTENSIKTPKYLSYLSKDIKEINNINNEIQNKLGYPCFVKPNSSGSSFGITKVYKKEDLKEAIDKVLKEDDIVLVEEYIKGIELTSGVIGNYYDENRKKLPIIEIVPSSDYFDYTSKYVKGKAQEIVPARISDELSLKVNNIANKIHDLFMCKGYSRIDVLVKDEDIYVLEINTLPGLTSNSLIPKMAGVVGINYTNLLDKIIDCI